MGQELTKIIFGLLGGLAVFIYGMNLMGDGLQKAAGERMRRILEVLTSNPLMGVLVGTLVTVMIQSSSATTVMVVGFVSAGLMTLPQAIGVIMGANIGTTITAQLIAFNIGDYTPLITAIGFLFFFFSKKKIVKYLGQTVFAFGLLFFGLETMSDVMEPLATSPVFESMIKQLSQYPILGLLTGVIMTVIVQSSSATIAVLQNVAAQSGIDGGALIDIQTAIPILLGNNIGTTITAIFASVGARLNAKRAAAAHTIFNVLGAVIFMFLIPIYAKLIIFISPKGPEIEIIKRQIANAHTAFNIINTIIWIPFVFVLAKIVTFIVRGQEDPAEKKIMYLDNKLLSNPAVAMDLATKELTRMALLAKQMAEDAKNSFINSDMKCVKKVSETEEVVDMLQSEIIKYLSTMLSTGTLTERQSVRLAGLMHVTHDIERIGDHCKNIAEFAEQKEQERIPFSKQALSELSDVFEMIRNMVSDSIKSLSEYDTSLAKKVLSEEYEVDDIEDKLRSRHVERLNKGLCDPKATIIFIDLIHNLERIGDHCNNIAEAVLNDLESKNVLNDHQLPNPQQS
ncbi:MAG TPA: Na/Pi cotransporter family protein [Pseudobacteroides sp.]|nr:Na/Pi cotransporter family protein [Pseudobacteroides sp.]